MKKCFKCGVEKAYTEFYQHKQMGDGYLNKCKECSKSDARKNRNDNLEYYREYDRNREPRQTLEDQKAYRAKNKNKAQEYRHRNRKEANARALVYQYVKKGKLEKLPCEICGEKKSVGHHEDYSKPLDVIWLCNKHHKWIHCNPRNGGRKSTLEPKGYKNKSDCWYQSLGYERKDQQSQEVKK